MLTCNAGGILDELVAVGHDGVIAERQLDFAAAWAFRGEGIAWTPDLDELEHARNGVAHEGGMPGYLTRDWLKDVDKVGLALNVLTTIVAKLISYNGPISDRASKVLSLSQDRMPAWWSATGSLELVTYSVD